MKSWTMAAMLAVTTLAPAGAEAATMLGNMHARPASGGNRMEFDVVSTGFTVGATPWTMTGASIYALGADFTMQLFGGGASGPSGTAIATLTPGGGTPGFTAQTITYTAPSISLAAGQTYWLTMVRKRGKVDNWMTGFRTDFDIPTRNVPPIGDGASYAGLMTGRMSAGLPTQMVSRGGFIPFFSLEGVSAVPEPATWAAMLSGFALVGGAMRRRRGGTRAVAA